MATGEVRYDTAKLRFVGACAAIAVGLAVAGSVDRATGGVIVLIGWIAGVATLHKLGRAGSGVDATETKTERAPAPAAASDVAAKDDDPDVRA